MLINVNCKVQYMSVSCIYGSMAIHNRFHLNSFIEKRYHDLHGVYDYFMLEQSIDPKIFPLVQGTAEGNRSF